MKYLILNFKLVSKTLILSAHGTQMDHWVPFFLDRSKQRCSVWNTGFDYFKDVSLKYINVLTKHNTIPVLHSDDDLLLSTL